MNAEEWMTNQEILDDFHKSDYVSFMEYMNTYFYEEDENEG